MANCNYCGWNGSIYQGKYRETNDYGTQWVVFVCPKCGADHGYSTLKDMPADWKQDFVKAAKWLEQA
jgi:hypothetical protein